MKRQTVIVVALVVLSVSAGAVYFMGQMGDGTQPSDPSEPNTSTVEEEYPSLDEVQGSEIVLREIEGQINVRYTSNILYCSIRDSSSGERLERIEPVEPNDSWDYEVDEVSVTCQPSGDGFVDEFPEQQEFYVPIE
jgi:hypothetical protein